MLREVIAMKLSNVVVMCLSALLGLLMVCFTVIACTMVVNWSAPDEAAILEGKVCSVQVFNSDYEVQPLADDSAPAFADMDANVDFDLVVDGTPDASNVVGVWFFPAVLPVYSHTASFPLKFSVIDSSLSFVRISFDSISSRLVYLQSGDISTTAYSYDGSGWGNVSSRLVYVKSTSVPSMILDFFSFFGAVKVSDSLDYIPVVFVPNYVQPVTDVFDGLGVWLISGLNSVVALFWVSDTGTLTLLGILAVAALAVSVFLLLMSIIQNFLHFRG